MGESIEDRAEAYARFLVGREMPTPDASEACELTAIKKSVLDHVLYRPPAEGAGAPFSDAEVKLVVQA